MEKSATNQHGEGVKRVEVRFLDAFYADSWTDAPALANPKLSPRGFRTVGPFRTFMEAHDHVPLYRREASHYKVRKLIVREDLVEFITNDHPPSAASTVNPIRRRRETS